MIMELEVPDFGQEHEHGARILDFGQEHQHGDRENTTTEEPLTTDHTYSKEITITPTTTENHFSSIRASALFTTTTTQQTTPSATPSPTPCIGGGLNRTDARLDEECGAHSEEAKCIVSNSACTKTSIASTWRCRCVQGYAEKNNSCLQLPTKLFRQESEKVSINLPESSPMGHQVLKVDFTEVDGFHKITPTAEMMGPGSDSFSVSPANTANFVVTVSSSTLSKSKYDIFVVVSVTVDGIVIRDFIHVVITITRNKIIEKNIFVIDGTPKDSVVGIVCQSCLSGDAVTTITPDDVVSVEKDGSIKTTTHINLDTLGGPQTIAYSSYIHIKQNGNLVANMTIIIVRLHYNISLMEDSGRNTVVGNLKLSIPFSINTRDLALNNNSLMLGSVSLDYQKEQEVHETLVLSVSGAAFSIQIIIKVQDVNNKAPVFLGAPYRFVTVQSAYTDLTVGVVTAVDHDMHAHLTYEIIPSDKLSINKNGVISIHSKFDPSTTIYNAKVTVRDGIYNDSEEITVDIRQAANVELNKTFNGTIDENEGAPTVIVTVKVFEYENYRFADQSAKNDFTIDSKTGEIRNARAFDREKEQEFKHTIVASKENEAACSLAVIGIVTILVKDVNDEPPIFFDAPYNATVVEEKQDKDLSVVPGLSTTDKDLNQTVIYSLLTNGETFYIDPKNGTIKTKVAIDREKHPLLDIKVNAFDGIHNSYTTVTVKIMDINDNDPVITGPKSYNVSEDSSVGTTVGLMTASDADEGKNAKITFDLVAEGGYFRINQITGNILVSRELDRETVGTHHMTVFARDNGDNIRPSSATVIVTIDDVNDNAPVFGQDQITVLFEENSSCANHITTISASDADKAYTPNSQIEYFLRRGEDNFKVNKQSGILTCNDYLDYEQKVSYEIIVEARDKGSPKMSSAQTVIVQVIDINDNSPIFVDINSRIIIRYFSGGRVVDIFKATDMDSGENGKVHFSIAGNATQFLQIGKVDGILRTKTDANTPPKGDYYLNVTVTDNGIKPLTNTTSLVVIVQQLIEQSIKFMEQKINMKIQENSPHNSPIESVSKYVINTENKNLMFDIIDESADLSFSLHRETGMVTVIKHIDREMKEIHEFVVRVRNTDTTEQSDLALVRVSIVDENDNEPIFVQKAYYFTINENEQIGTVVSPPERKIMATDADSGDNALIEFKLYGEGCHSAFSPKYEGSNTLSIQLAVQVDYEVNRRCSFTIEAFNPNDMTKSSNVSVVIDITDYNDNVPEFEGHSNYVYTVSLPEDTNINTNLKPFGQVFDKDSRENGDIELSVVNDDGCWFTVNRVVDEMFLKVKPTIILDYDKGDVQNTCTLKASDKGVPKLSSTATLSINITDVNDNPPVISDPDIILNVSRDADPGTVIVDRIPTTDIDSGVNGMLVYRLESSEHSSRFAIDANTGKITVNTVLQSVQKDEIMLSVIVSDKGLPQRSTRAQVTIKIKDDNPRPFFVVPSVSVNIQEHTNIDDGILGVALAHDRKDSGEINICDCTYLLDTKRDDIIIGKDTGVIKFRNSNHTLDRENEYGGQVIVGVIATDKGENPKNSSTMQFKIKISDINDQVPVFNRINYAFGIFQYAPDETYIGEVNAVDLDENPVTHYFINITESSVGSVVKIDKLTGKIVKSGNMSLSSAQNVQIKVGLIHILRFIHPITSPC
ncbi:FAT4 [Mytilus coruscus]|uniref:FAT4 n=1 Tax=Mytilus coruscus TaxID=42192 RepID=A0A6J8E0R9_MYTCO|nr:FAT4 [Mytilus coruscus]